MQTRSVRSRYIWINQTIKAVIIAAGVLNTATVFAAVFESDDFSSPSLNTALWDFEDPVGDSSFAVSGGELAISVGGGNSHDVWIFGNLSARIMQDTDNVDFEIEAKFSSMPGQQYQMHGILVQQDDSNFLRFDLYSDGFNLHAFSATFSGGSPNVRHDSIVSPNGPNTYLRVTRTGNQWELSVSTDGTSWSVVTSYNFSMNVSRVGPFVGNAGGNAPAYTGIVDYFFNTAAPIIPEDGDTGGPDTTPPNILSESVSAISGSEVRVSWATDEPADTLVEYGLTTAYELGAISDPALTTNHDVVVSGLNPSSTYHFRFATADAAGNTTVSSDYAVSTSALPVIDVWYGDSQTFGLLGEPQWAANILGNASDPDGIASLTYSLNGGPAQPLSLGPDGLRLADAGDFNIELQFLDLAVGSNSVTITATDGVGLQNTRTVIVNYPGPTSWPRDYGINWSTATEISNVAQVVDGKWEIQGDKLRSRQFGYDRLIAFGDEQWQDYEVIAEMTVNEIDPRCSQNWCAGGGAVLGILVRWPGHFFWGQLPHHGWYPMGGMAAFAWKGNGYMEMYRGRDGVVISTDPGASFQIGVPHLFKMRAETLAGSHRYSAKLWPASQPEPVSWNLVLDEPLSATSSGSALLVAHHVDVSVGNVTVTEINGSGGPGPDTTPPVITAVQATAISDTSATITWQTDEPASSEVAYGETPAYADGTVSNAALVTSHSISLSGLSPSTQYHYQVTSADGDGNSASSVDFVFTTGDSAPPIGLTSDDFSGGLNTALWTFVDPLGDSGVSTTGSQLAINIPPGASHDIWAGTNHAPRVVQSVVDGDFEVEVKFDSAITQGYQMQGIVAEQDTGNLVRFDFYSDGGRTHIFAASFNNGTPNVRNDDVIASGTPMYMRMKREGDLWTQSYSYDGTSWTTSATFTDSLTVSTVGVFGGNFDTGNSAPAHTALIDYFNVLSGSSGPPPVDTTPPIISNVQVSSIGETTATITWTTNELADSAISYGPSSAYEDGTLSDGGLVTSHSMTLTGLSDSTEYHFMIESADSSGNVGTTGDQTFTTDTPPPVDVTPPVISNLQVSAISETSATVTWTTDEPATSVVAYGPTSAYEDGTISTGGLTTAHSIVLSNLSASTTYHFEASSADASSNTAASGDQTFTTDTPPPVDTTPPVISDLQVSAISETSATVTWTTDEPATSVVAYGPTSAYEDGTESTAGLTTAHSVVLSNLSASTTYHFEASSADANGNTASSGDQTFTTDTPPPVDTTPPAISAIQVSAIGDTQATISWQTDEPASSAVSYGTSAAYENGTVSDSALVTSHSMTLTGLASDTTYHYQVAATDANGNGATSADLTFTTDAVPPAPSGIVSDEFSGPLNTSLWTFDDPLGDSSVSTTGSQVAISVPAGPSHDVWAATNHAPRLMQTVNDDDFEIEVKFDSAMSLGYQMQGILAEQDGNNLVRFDFYNDGGQTHVFAARFRGGSPAVQDDFVITSGNPMYMRVQRQGDTWTLRYSYDGFNWLTAVSFTNAMTVARVGVFGGNFDFGNSAPAHTALIDYLRVLQ